MKKRDVFYNFFEYALSMCIILQCNSLMMVNSGIIKKVFNIVTLLLILSLAIISFFKIKFLNQNVLNTEKLKWFSIFLLLYSLDFIIIEYFFVHKFNAITVFFFLISPIAFVTYFFEQKINHKNGFPLLRKIVILIFILEVTSLIGLVLINTGFKPNVTFFSQWSKQEVSGYYYLDFITQYNSFLGINNVVRNTGVFAEAPMYSYVLCISLIIQSFIKKGKNNNFDKLNYLVTLITIFTTLSTTGIIISILTILIKIVEIIFEKYNDGIKYIISFFLTIIGGVSALFLFLNKKKSSPGSYSSLIRSDDIHACIKSWFDHPFFGVGINNNDYISHYALAFRHNSFGLSTGLFSVLAFGGIALTIFYLVPLIISFFNNIRVLIISLFLLILFIYTIIPFTYLFSLLLSYLWFEFLFYEKGEKIYEVFSSRIRSFWINFCSRSSQKG